MEQPVLSPHLYDDPHIPPTPITACAHTLERAYTHPAPPPCLATVLRFGLMLEPKAATLSASQQCSLPALDP